MHLPNVAPSETTAAVQSFHEPWTRFAAWAADELGCALAFDGTLYRLEHDTFDDASEGSQADSNPTASTIRRRWSLRRSKHKERIATEAKSTEPLLTATTQTELLNELLQKLRAGETPPSLRPQYEPHAVHELTDRLFDAYQLDAGKALVAGCHLEEVPFIRRTSIKPLDANVASRASGEARTKEAKHESTDGATDEHTVVSHRYYDADGASVPAELVKQLGLNETKSASEPIPRLTAPVLDRIASLTESTSESNQSNAPQLFVIVWARRASGRLRFEFGSESVEAPFEGWAKLLKAPPVVCPRTGRETFSLTTLDTGEIVAAEEVIKCEVTSHRHVADDLARCTVTGKLVEPDLLKPCPQTGELVLGSEFGTCPRCRLSIPQTLTTPMGCQICDSAKRVEPNHPTLMAIQAKNADSVKLGEPQLEGAKLRWQLAETDETIVLVNDGWFRRRVATFEKATLELKHQAEASRFSNSWRPV